MTEATRKPWHLSGRDCAAALDIAPSTFSERGYVPALKDGRRKFYDIRHIVRAEAISGIHAISDGEVIDHDAEKARLTKARRIAQELDNAEREGKLRPIAEAADAVEAALVPVCAMLDSLPLQIKRECPELSHQSVETMQRTIAKSRNALADEIVETGKRYQDLAA